MFKNPGACFFRKKKCACGKLDTYQKSLWGGEDNRSGFGRSRKTQKQHTENHSLRIAVVTIFAILVSDGPQIRRIQFFFDIFTVPGSNNAVKQLMRMQLKTYQSGALSKSLGKAEQRQNNHGCNNQTPTPSAKASCGCIS